MQLKEGGKFASKAKYYWETDSKQVPLGKVENNSEKRVKIS